MENFDVAMSFLSIEHTGLGRYGDALSPYGDVDADKQVHCMLKPGVLFFLALPTSWFKTIRNTSQKLDSTRRS